ncbi:hypothetical protein [Paraburkholderia sp. BL25I1N1]|uniref:hypothetical protein n=1 Tax=Paraburkholderia sp. BL25I1N1 TaxID=1938804 RepID=UPI0015E5C058|nr:hypothetical protein [Paraburkholderia sp. BL25I1N1]
MLHRREGLVGQFNEVEALATSADAPAGENGPGKSVAGNPRRKRGHKPFNPNLPREIVRHEFRQL